MTQSFYFSTFWSFAYCKINLQISQYFRTNKISQEGVSYFLRGKYSTIYFVRPSASPSSNITICLLSAYCSLEHFLKKYIYILLYVYIIPGEDFKNYGNQKLFLAEKAIFTLILAIFLPHNDGNQLPGCRFFQV